MRDDIYHSPYRRNSKGSTVADQQGVWTIKKRDMTIPQMLFAEQVTMCSGSGKCENEDIILKFVNQ